MLVSRAGSARSMLVWWNEARSMLLHHQSTILSTSFPPFISDAPLTCSPARNLSCTPLASLSFDAYFLLQGVDFGEHFAFKDATLELPHAPFPWRVNYNRLSLLLSEVQSSTSRMRAVEELVASVVANNRSGAAEGGKRISGAGAGDSIGGGDLQARQGYLFEVRDDFIYGWGSPIDAAIARLDKAQGDTSDDKKTGARASRSQDSARFGRVADNVLEEARRRAQGLPIPFLPFPTEWSGG
jgi:hypothetical protein